MTPFEEAASEYFAALDGPDHENAWHRLIECRAKIVPLAHARFRDEADVAKRVVLVNIAWRADPAAALPFLREALRDPHPEVWKEVLDGLVAAGASGAVDALRDEQTRADTHKAEWIAEAIGQVDSE
jgi:hypothetical protein